MKKERAYPERPPKRGPEGQRERRERESDARKLLATYMEEASLCGASAAEAAEEIGVPASTLNHFVRRRELDHLEPKPLGPPAKRADRAMRAEILGVFAECGPSLGLPTLRCLFPEVARRELTDYRDRYRRAYVHGKTVDVEVLDWRVRGAVWAIDYTTPPCPVDASYPQILSVRDLASYRHLMALPVHAATAKSTAEALAALFVEHGPPLVLKHDNGTHFTAGEVSAVLDGAGVLRLPSPPYTPPYNGSCEAGIGAHATRAHHEAARHGRPGEWTCDDVEAARLSANQTGRPWGAHGPTPDEAWADRRPLCDGMRRALRDAVDRLDQVVRLERGLVGLELGERELASLRREVTRRALVALGILVVKRRETRLPLSTHLRANYW